MVKIMPVAVIFRFLQYLPQPVPYKLKPTLLGISNRGKRILRSLRVQ
ncbi:hypothetical protein A464_1721 [Salmonella bongori N268-08]|uniref:Uncharacterized protein n=1 Tax=Salmonella bongori N268-08 TaxID=1197719 RepID=S5MQ87_SALBN|nr:hypothetical protein A464_1721 [Salmonella bongori N268-08]